jgi:NAD(P)-dependent dehydrogenase (short-subunit alcohol dehydrogenase family)
VIASLQDKVTVVTGAASGLGEAMARRFAAEGAQVVLADVAPLDALAAELGAFAVPTDVSDQASVDALAAATFEHFGQVDVVCNNAGTVTGGLCWEIPLESWRRILDVNLMGVIHGVRAFVPQLLESGGHVVNTASMAAVGTMPHLGPYAVSKHGILALSEVLFHDLALVGADVGVSVLCPGYVPTRIGLPDRTAPVPDPAPGQVGAADVADAVLDAILTRRFYVFTHPDSLDLVTRRVDAITQGLAPAHL